MPYPGDYSKFVTFVLIKNPVRDLLFPKNVGTAVGFEIFKNIFLLISGF